MSFDRKRLDNRKGCDLFERRRIRRAVIAHKRGF